MSFEITSGDTKRSGWPQGTGMIYLAMSPWHGMWKNRQQLMSRFAREMPVLYVEPWARLRRVRRQLLSPDFAARRKNVPTVEKLAPNLFVYHSPARYAVSGSRLLANLTQKRWLQAVRRAARAAGIEKPILWISLPEMAFALDNLGECVSIYHVVDEYGGYTGRDRLGPDKLRNAEQQLLDDVDLTIVVSPELAELKSGAGRTIALVENAVDFQAFREASEVRRRPAEFDRIPGPRLGYSGLIGKRLNLGLLLLLARRHPDWSIVLVGSVDRRGCEDAIDALDRMENVYFLGETDVSRVPHYISAFDIGLLPYELNLETRHISPLKLFEYLAAGKPVVATEIPSAVRHQAVISVAREEGQFAECCRKLIDSPPDNSTTDLFLRYAAANTWDHRVQEISVLLGRELDRVLR